MDKVDRRCKNAGRGKIELREHRGQLDVVGCLWQMNDRDGSRANAGAGVLCVVVITKYTKPVVERGARKGYLSWSRANLGFVCFATSSESVSGCTHATLSACRISFMITVLSTITAQASICQAVTGTGADRKALADFLVTLILP